MNEDQKKQLTERVLDGPEDYRAQLEWTHESMAKHATTEQRLKARFRLAAFMNDDATMEGCGKDIAEVRTIQQYLRTEIIRLTAEVANLEPLAPPNKI